MKLGRKYKLTFELTEPAKSEIEGLSVKQAIEITNPLTLEFEVTRNTASSLNSATFRIYNLSDVNRNLIFRNRTSINNINGNRNKVILQAGYETTLNKDSDLSTIFIGDLLEAYSYRQGPNVITYINAQDAGFGAYNSFVNKTVEAGTALKEIAELMMSSLKGIKKGVIGETLGVSKTTTTLNGNVFYLLTKDYKDEVFIDLEKVNKLGINEYIKSTGGKVPLLTSETGLLGTPLRQGTDLIVDMLFEPRINVGQLVEIKSQINKQFDGQYKVNGVKHSGIISGAVNGDCRTTLQLFIGNELSGALKGI